MNTCGSCQFFGEPIGRGDHHVPTGYHKCKWIEQYGAGGKIPTEPAVVVDGSGYYAALCVKEEFGCTQWRPTNSIEG